MLIWVGIVVVLVGILVRYAPSGLFSWFGHLPGDIRVESGRTRFYAPISSMLVVSVVLSVVVSLVARFLKGR